MSALTILLTVPAPPCMTSKGSALLKSVVAAVMAATRWRSSAVRSLRCSSTPAEAACVMPKTVKPTKNFTFGLLKYGVRIIQAFRAFNRYGSQVQSHDYSLYAARLLNQGIDHGLHHGIAFLVALPDHLVVGLHLFGAGLHGLHGLEGGLQLVTHFRIERRIFGLDEVGQAGAFHGGAIHPVILAQVDIHHAELIVEMRIMGVVGEAVVLFLGIVQHQTQFDAFASQFAIR